MSKAPRFSSSAIDVVKTLVSPARLPPTMVAIPSSPKPLLKAAVIESIIDQKVSRMRVKSVLKPDAPRVFARSLSWLSALPRALAVKLTIMGVTSMACPIAMPFRVYRRFRNPNSPARDIRRNRSKPSATVGMPINALKIPLITHFPLKLYKPRNTAIGMLHRHDSRVPKPATYIVL